MQIVEILIILTICIVFIVYTQLYTIRVLLNQFIMASIIVTIIPSINGVNITNKSPEYFLKACL